MGANMVSMVELMYLTSMVVGLFYVFIACFVIDELSYPAGMYLAFSVFFVSSVVSPPFGYSLLSLFILFYFKADHISKNLLVRGIHNFKCQLHTCTMNELSMNELSMNALGSLFS